MPKIDRLQLNYDLTFETPFHCGTGLRVGLIDRTILHDHDGYLYVPGSTLKGCVREQCEQLARLYEELDGEMRERIASPHEKQKALWAIGHPITMVTRIFGSPHSPGRLFFDDARQTEKDKQQYDGSEKEKGKYKNLQATPYTQVRIDRPTRTAVPGALYTSEFGTRDVTFEGSITGWLACTAIETLGGIPTYSLLLLLAGLQMIERLGGNKSAGKGRCSITIKQLMINGTQCEGLWPSWLDHLETLSYYSTYAAGQEEVW
jgi:CRISPR/Cas system CSM-associated protein Csm3 (group 7 of RAMP superfamily)